MTDSIERGSFSIWQDGVKVAGGSGPLAAVRAMAEHYAMIYQQDGPTKTIIRRLTPRPKKTDITFGTTDPCEAPCFDCGKDHTP